MTPRKLTVIAHHSNNNNIIESPRVAVTEMILALERKTKTVKNQIERDRIKPTPTPITLAVGHQRNEVWSVKWIRLNRARTWNWVHRFKLEIQIYRHWTGRSSLCSSCRTETIHLRQSHSIFLSSERNRNQSIQIKLSWMHKLEDGMKMERITWTESADESWNILQVERKERSQIHMHTTLHKYSQTNNTMFDAFHLHLSISIWIRSSSDHIGFGFGFQIKSKRKFTPIESNRISKGIEKRKRKETKRNEIQKRIPRLIGRQSGNEDERK